MNNFENLLRMKEIFSLEVINFGVNQLVNRKAKKIDGYQEKILRIRGPILVLTFTIFSIKSSSKGSLNHGLKGSLSLFLKVGIQITPLIIRQLCSTLS